MTSAASSERTSGILRLDVQVPISATRTLVQFRGLGVKGEPEERRLQRVRDHSGFWGPFGRHLPEDMVVSVVQREAMSELAMWRWKRGPCRSALTYRCSRNGGSARQLGVRVRGRRLKRRNGARSHARRPTLDLVLGGDDMADDSATTGFVMNQTMLRVRDPDISVAFYRDVLGMTELARYDFEEMQFSLYFMGTWPMVSRSPRRLASGPSGSSPDPRWWS